MFKFKCVQGINDTENMKKYIMKFKLRFIKKSMPFRKQRKPSNLAWALHLLSLVSLVKNHERGSDRGRRAAGGV